MRLRTTPLAALAAGLTVASYSPALAQTAPNVPHPTPSVTVTLTPVRVAGGDPSTGKATLRSAAPAGGTVVKLSSGSPCATVPASVTVPAGQTSATFPIATTPVSRDTYSVITATTSQAYRITLYVKAARLRSLEIPAALRSSQDFKGTVRLDARAPQGGCVVTLRPQAAGSPLRYPSSVTVPAGQSVWGFVGSVGKVTVQARGQIVAEAGGSVVSASTTLAP